MHNKTFILITSIVMMSFLSFYCIHHNKNKKETQYIAQQIISIFQKYVLTYDIDKKSIDSQAFLPSIFYPLNEYQELSKKIVSFLEQNQPLILTMVGFPYKSANIKEKVISVSVDAAERYSLMFLQSFLNEIKSIYPQEVKLIIFTDGIIFCDIEQVMDNTVICYENTLKIITQDLPNIEICTMSDLYPNQSPLEIREMISNMSPLWQTFQDMVKNNEKLQDDINTLAQRLAFELALSELTKQEIIDIAVQETHRSMQYSNFLKQFRPEETITCSVHYQNHLNKKIGLKLSDSYVTPWHGALVETNGIFTINYLQDINQKYYRLAYLKVNGISLPYFKHI